MEDIVTRLRRAVDNEPFMLGGEHDLLKDALREITTLLGCCDGTAAQDAHIRREREEHRAEVDRQRAEIEQLRAGIQSLAESLRASLDAAIRQRDEARAEIERQRVENERLRAENERMHASFKNLALKLRRGLEGKP